MYTNADKLMTKRRDELFANSATYEPHIIVVTEVKPKNSKEYSLDDYKLEGYRPLPCAILRTHNTEVS